MAKTVGKTTFRDDGTIVVREVRASYANVFNPRAQENDDGTSREKYSITGIMPIKGRADEIKAILSHLEGLSKEHFKKKLPAANMFFRDGRPTNKEEYENSFLVVASQTKERPPKVVNRNPKKAVTEEMGLIYSGAWVTLIVNPWFQKADPKKKQPERINANLLVVQYVREDEAFASGIQVDPNEALDDISGEFEDEMVDMDEDDLGLDD